MISFAVVQPGREEPIEPSSQKLLESAVVYKPITVSNFSEVRITLKTGYAPHCCRIHHSALMRMVGRSVVRGDEDWRSGWRSPLTEEHQYEMPIGAPSYGLYPPIVVMPDQGPGWLMGPLTEERMRCLWDWREENGELVVEARLVPWGVEGGSRASEHWYVERIEPGVQLEPSLFENYNHALQGVLGASSRSQGITWATWNDGIFRDIDQERIFGVADYIRENLPEVRWLQADDGWAGPNATVSTEDGSLAMSDLSVFYQPERLTNDPRFPDGMKGLADGIRQRGLRPLIWLTPAVLEGSALYEDHPDWFLPDARLSFVPEMRFLDFSLPQSREFVESALDMAFLDWGFEGTKLDFWTMSFDESGVRQASFEKTSIEWMDWLLEQIRKRIPPDGLVLHCISIPFGAPFRARWCDHFRYYADSEGSCAVQDMVKEQALWAAFLVGLYGVQQFWIPNGDGFGLFEHIDMPENEHRRWAAFLLGSGTITELSGWLHLKKDQQRLERIRQVCQWARFGQRVELPGYSFEKNPPEPPSVWVRRESEGDGLVAITNWTDEAMTTTFPGERPMVSLFDGQEALPGTPIIVGPRDGMVFVPKR